MSTKETSRPNEQVVVARVGAPHGVRGDVRVQPFTADPLALADYSPLLVAKAAKGLPQQLTISSARRSKTVLVVRFAEVATREMAEALKGCELSVPRARLDDADLEEDEFFVADLVGLTAYDPAGGQMGKVVAVENYGAGDILEIQPLKGPRFMVAFTEQNVPELAIEQGRLTIDAPETVEAKEGA
ncbi:MAG: ribosome maturation factor RimM [Pseudomonadota bacterium]